MYRILVDLIQEHLEVSVVTFQREVHATLNALLLLYVSLKYLLGNRSIARFPLAMFIYSL